MKTEPKKSLFRRFVDFLSFKEEDDSYYEDEYYEKVNNDKRKQPLRESNSGDRLSAQSKRSVYPEYEEDLDEISVSTKKQNDDIDEDIIVYEEPIKEPEEHILSVDVYETRDSIYVIAFTAGARRTDLSITLSRTTIIIQGERQLPYFSSSDSSFHSQELTWGKFSREIILPEEVEIELTDAKEENGLLTIKLTKVDRQKTARIKVA